MKYRPDPDLEFLSQCSSASLEGLFKTLVYDKNGKRRYSEQVTKSAEYQQYQSDYAKYWQLLARELQCFGGDTIVNRFRGTGVLYREILGDVCSKLDVTYSKSASVAEIEAEMFRKIIQEQCKDLSQEELTALANQLGVENAASLKGSKLVAAIMYVISNDGKKYLKLLVIILDYVLKALVGRGLVLGGGVVASRALSLAAGPVGWVIATAATVTLLTAPAYRVTIPAVIQVAFLRLQKAHPQEVMQVLEM